MPSLPSNQMDWASYVMFYLTAAQLLNKKTYYGILNTQQSKLLMWLHEILVIASDIFYC